MSVACGTTLSFIYKCIAGAKMQTKLIYNEEVIHFLGYSLHFFGHAIVCFNFLWLKGKSHL